ncbi:MAG TPA: phage holin family protein [Candidatus Sulfotelmatobacter sp.]|nr:phage holin family protein [Candidatus Sulfotelmatobacter sp.]
MKNLLRNTLFNAFALFLITQILPGVKVYGGLPAYVFGGLVLTVLLILLKPVLNLLAMPLNLITLGMFSFLVNVIIFYLLTVLVIGVSITSFTFPGYSYAGFVIPRIYFNTLFAFILTSFLQSLIFSFLNWVTKN